MDTLEQELLLYKLFTAALNVPTLDETGMERGKVGGEVLTNFQFLQFVRSLTKSMSIHWLFGETETNSRLPD